MTRKLLIATLGALALAVGPFSGVAHAATYSAHCSVASGIPNDCTSDGVGTSAAYATYTDSSNKFCITDDRKDGHSVIVKMWRKGSPGNFSTLWNIGGKNTTSCLVRQAGVENADWVMKACIGEWNQTANQSTILDCGQPKNIVL